MRVKITYFVHGATTDNEKGLATMLELFNKFITTEQEQKLILETEI